MEEWKYKLIDHLYKYAKYPICISYHDDYIGIDFKISNTNIMRNKVFDNGHIHSSVDDIMEINVTEAISAVRQCIASGLPTQKNDINHPGIKEGTGVVIPNSAKYLLD